ncbi:MAG TPA: carboxyl transferase domain-containing protein [Usitatibacter sp.]
MSAVAAQPLLDVLKESIAFKAGGEPVGNLTMGRGTFDGRPLHVAIVEGRIASGSLGTPECQCLSALFDVVARERSSLVMYLDSAGARVSEGLKALGAFRSLYRSGLDAAFSGAPIAVVLGRNCFGGASMIAHLAPQRLFGPNTQMAMSGPSIIASASGVSVLDEVFRAMADASLSPAARVKVSPANDLWIEGDRLSTWLTEALAQRGDAAAALRARHEALELRLDKRVADRPWEPVRRRDLEKIYDAGYDARESDGFLLGKGTRGGLEESLAGIVGRNALGASRAWRFADAIWKMGEQPPERLQVLLDCASHAARLDDERIVLTEYIVDMGFALSALARRGTQVGLTVLGKAGGGVYVALAAPAQRVTSVYGSSDIQVLPGAAVAAILGQSTESTPSFQEYLAAGVADEELKLGFIPGTQ